MIRKSQQVFPLLLEEDFREIKYYLRSGDKKSKNGPRNDTLCENLY